MTPAVLLLLAWELAAPAQDSPPAGSSLRVDVDLVLLQVTVTDASGRFLRGLKAENFRVYDNGVEQAIHHFTTEDLPFSMGLVLDRSGSMTMMIDEVYQAAFHTIKASKSADEFFISTFNEVFEMRQDLSTDRELLEKRLKGVVADGRTALYDAVLTAVQHIQKGRYDKKALLVVTDGADNSSRIYFSDLLDRIRQENVVIYVVGLFGMASKVGLDLERESTVRELTELAEATGGQAYFPRTMKECEQACVAIAEELRQQYGLGYYPHPRQRDGSWHTLQVQLELPADLSGKAPTPRTRTGYFAPRD